jgi:hypothetical protein
VNIYWWVALVIYCVICGVLSAYLANEKGRSGRQWFACGFFCGILGLIAAAGVPPACRPSFGIKNCPDCAETIGQRARLCPHCGHVFTTGEDSASLASALTHSDPRVRRDAIKSVPQSVDSDTFSRLVAALRDPDDDVRFAAIEALAATGKPEAAGALVKMLDGYSEADKRTTAGLRRMGEIAVPYLEQASGEGPAYRRSAARRVLKSISDDRKK